MGGVFLIKLNYLIIILFLPLLVVSSVNAGTVYGYFHPTGYYYGKTGYHEWIDHCPLCGENVCLRVGMKGIRDEISCKYCGADYDGTNGMDKWKYGSRAQLTPYPNPSPKETIAQDEKQEEDKIEYFIKRVSNTQKKIPTFYSSRILVG